MSGIPSGTVDPDFPWASVIDVLLGRRCRAVMEPQGHGQHWGRCEFRRHSVLIDHCLERGMHNVRWSTAETFRG